MSALSLFVLSHDRPDFLRQTLHSILEQTNRDFELVVSDNSSNDEVEQMMRAEFPHVEYRRRTPMLQYLAHFNSCIDEATSDYFCLFHDDDWMHPDFVNQTMKALDAHPQVVACACNAKIETMGEIGARTSFRALGKLVWIPTVRDLARRYFSRAQSGIAPFPAYIYRRSLVGDVRVPVDGGKYADVTLLLELATKGPVLWLNEALMTYRIHGANVGTSENMRDRLKLLGYLKKNLTLLGKDVLADYRCSFIYKKIANSKTATGNRLSVAQKFLSYYGLVRYANISLYGALVKRALIKRIVE
jgi:glycosyltransferase involved in cell wall biosynthesis